MKWILLFALCSCSKESEHKAVPITVPTVMVEAEISSFQMRTEAQQEAARRACNRDGGTLSFSGMRKRVACYEHAVTPDGLAHEGACLWEVEVGCDDTDDEYQCHWTRFRCETGE